MASCTEPPYTPECRSLSLHSTWRTQRALRQPLGGNPAWPRDSTVNEEHSRDLTILKITICSLEEQSKAFLKLQNFGSNQRNALLGRLTGGKRGCCPPVHTHGFRDPAFCRKRTRTMDAPHERQPVRTLSLRTCSHHLPLLPLTSLGPASGVGPRQARVSTPVKWQSGSD